MPAYKSYCWSLGTTSFRMVEFNRKIEKQLEYLNEFWAIPENTTQAWTENEPVQIAYYDFLKSKNFIEGDASRKAKDAREKTSGLVFLGLLDDERRLTPAGHSMLNLAQAQDFNRNNLLQIPADSDLYFRQQLKAHVQIDGENVRPYVVLAMALNRLGEITNEEFTYLLPLAVNQEKTEEILSGIEAVRRGERTVDDIIVSILMEMPNYIEARQLLIDNDVSENLIMEVGMNRKSRNYDKVYYTLYQALSVVNESHADVDTVHLLDVAKSIKGKCSTLWKQYLFNTTITRKVARDGYSTLNIDKKIFNCANETEFKAEYFRLLHLFKARSLLSDYFDLNRRYFKTTDTLLFQDSKVKFDIIPNCYFNIVDTRLSELAFSSHPQLGVDTDLSSIVGINVTQENIFSKVEELYGVQVRNLYDVQAFVDRERYERFNRMVDEKFTDENLISLMTMFEERKDDDIQNMVTNNADVPTIFEYVLAIAWYKISGRQGRVLEYMNLSLDADLLPITHAGGGHEDITYQYEGCDDYPKHTLLIEATLASGTNQRRMEAESVPRHLGEYMLAHPDTEAYCVFGTPYLHINVVSVFRNLKTGQYYSLDGQRWVDGLKIIPCQTSEIKTIIQRQISYAQLYSKFAEAFESDAAPNVWYEQEVKARLQ